jgi:starch phosphorylase
MDIEKLSGDLRDLALDLRWSWNHASDELWSHLNPELWELTKNPWVVLQTVAGEKLRQALADTAFAAKLDSLMQTREERLQRQRWFQKTWPDAKLTCTAYFSMEFMLSDALPIFSGGLGNVAGDQLKSADDLGVPVVGVGLLYQQGYFRQHIDAEGWQHALYPYNDPGQLPISPLRDANGEWLRIAIELPGFTLRVRCWQVQVGRTKLLLLDTNDPANLPEYRGITGELYGGTPLLRLQQERILGIGGWRLLRVLGINPEVCHLNEGHAAFAVLERARWFMEENHVPFAQALAATRPGNLFTTHTAVAAGFDRFQYDAMVSLTDYCNHELHISLDELLALGRAKPGDKSEPFNMAYLAIRGSGAVNGVSQLHGQVSRRLFQSLFQRWPEEDVPVGAVTNGIHMPTWDSDAADDLWTDICGKDRWRGDLEKVEEKIRQAPSDKLWGMRERGRKSLVEYARQTLTRQLAGNGATPDQVDQARRIFDPATLTLGFARRFATYKRPNLLLHDPDRLLRILMNRQHPVQLILAGKAHPADHAGQEMIHQWIQFIRNSPARSQVVFLSDYDMRLAQHLVGGVDLWLNTPRRPWEASGTSGMKVLVNGGLNFSELDGWWAEAYAPEVGWALGDGKEHGEDPGWDAAEADRLYTLLEQEIIPEFYHVDDKGLPQGWIARMRESMARLTTAFSANRAVRQYTEQHYLPAAKSYLERAKDGGAEGKAILDWQRQINEHWYRLRFGAMHVESHPDHHVVTVQVYLDELNPQAVRVELFAANEPSLPEVRQTMQGQPLAGAGNAFSFSATVAADRPADRFTPRIVPEHAGARVPLECPQILWYR